VHVTAFEKKISRSQPRLKNFKRDHSRDEKFFSAKTPDKFQPPRRSAIIIPENYFKDQMRSQPRLKIFTCDHFLIVKKIKRDHFLIVKKLNTCTHRGQLLHRFLFPHITYGKPILSLTVPAPKTATRTFFQMDGGLVSAGTASCVISPEGGTNARCICVMGVSADK
jgi:hypothetical protein